MAIKRNPQASDPATADAIDKAFPVPAPRESPENLPEGTTYTAFDEPDAQTDDRMPATLNEAVAWFQANLPAVAKKSEGKVEKDGRIQYTYRYANLADIHNAALPLIGGRGLSWRCKPTLTEQGFGLVYKLKHISGEEDGGFWPLGDPRQIKPQAMGSLITYAKRYTLCAMLGIAPEEDDDDGRAAQQEAIERQQAERDERNWSRQRPGAAPAVPETTPVGGKSRPVIDQSSTLAELAKQWAALPEAAKAAHLDDFGAEFAARVEKLVEPEDVKKFYAEIKALAGDMKASGLMIPWPYGGIQPGDRLRAHAEKVAMKAKNRHGEFSEAIAAAMTPERLDEIETEMAGAVPAGQLTEAERADLAGFLKKREASITSAPRPEPEPAATDDGSDPWANAVPEPSAADDFGDFEAGAAGPAPAEPVTEAATDPSMAYTMHFAAIWKGGPVAELQPKLDADMDSGTLTEDEYSRLSVMLADRPTVLPTLCHWRAQLAPSTVALDSLRDEVIDLQAKGQLDDIRHITAAISKQRIELKNAGQ